MTALPSDTCYRKDTPRAFARLRLLMVLAWICITGLAQAAVQGPVVAEEGGGSARSASAPHEVRGRVIDGATGKPLAFVNIVVEGTRNGGMTDIDGFFLITHSRPVENLLLTYVGYLPVVHEVTGDRGGQFIEMHQSAVELAGVEVTPGENPAHRIIRNVMDNRDANNPEKQGAFSYHSYNKFVFTGEFDNPVDQPLVKDSLTVRLAGFLEDHHFFMMETVVERRFMPPSRDNETILASRVSGFENPVLALLMTQMQSFSFYNNQVEISGSRYVSPLAPGSLDRYFFLLEDTTYTGRDTVFIISYRPARNRNFEGLSGSLYVNTNGWALQNVIAGPAGENGNARVRIRQKYELVDGKAWFPTQLDTDFELVNLDELNNFRLLGNGRTYLQDIRLDASLRRRDFSPFYVEFSPASLVDDEQYWERFRTDSLSIREQNTYQYLDSLADAKILDRRMELIETLLSGVYRMGRLDLSLIDLVAWSPAEGFRTALSLETNRHFSQKLGLSGLLAYGFGDDRVKYGGGGYVVLDRLSDLRLGYDYKMDLAERGGSSFIGPRSPLSPEILRRFFLETMDMHERHQVWLQGRTWRNFLSIKAYAAADRVSPTDGYTFYSPDNAPLEPVLSDPSHGALPDPGDAALSNPSHGVLPDPGDAALSDPRRTVLPDPRPAMDFPGGEQRYFETGLQFRLAYGERFILTPGRILSMGEEVPVLQLNIAKGWEGPLRGQYNYWRLEAMFRKSFPIRMLGTQRLVVMGGLVEGEVPWTRLFTAPAAYARFGFSVPHAFSTMRMDEFVTGRYVALFWQHDFENLLYRSEKFNPRFVLLTNAGIGWHPAGQSLHSMLPGPMDKGFVESGLAVKDLYRLGMTWLGLEFMYRYGPYGLPEFRDNFSLRISYSVGF
jgi:hypothetical protein